MKFHIPNPLPAINHTIEQVQQGAEHVINEVTHETAQQVGVSIEKLDDIQKAVIASAQTQAQKLIDDAVKAAQGEAERLKLNAADIVLDVVIDRLKKSSKWYLRLAGAILENLREKIIAELKKEL